MQPIDVDRREASVAALCARYAVDAAQAARVKRTAEHLYAQTSAWWDGDQYLRWLGWAADIHGIGARVDARHYHRHGAYVVRHSVLPGFSEHERRILALLVRGHRRSFPALAFQAFAPELAKTLMRLVAVLRIAVILERSHSDAHSPVVDAKLSGDSLDLALDAGWLEAHPLSKKELEVEIGQLENAGIRLSLCE